MCQQGEVVAGGGLKVTRNTFLQADVWAASSRPWDSKDDANTVPEDGWLAKSYNDTDQDVRVRAFATCVPK